MWATSVIIKQLFGVNNHPLGENSPKLVTLLGVFVCETIADKSRPK
jgi:hypothetical protein